MQMNSLSSVVKSWLLLTGAIFLTALNRQQAAAADSEKSRGKILFVVTSHAQKGETGQPTGYYLSEVAHPWDVLVKAGYQIDFVSPQGGKAPVEGFDLT